jgi:hypothetical protein
LEGARAQARGLLKVKRKAFNTEDTEENQKLNASDIRGPVCSVPKCRIAFDFAFLCVLCVESFSFDFQAAASEASGALQCGAAARR